MSTFRFVLYLFLLFGYHLRAQFISARVGVDGLTCSACSNATEQSILKLDFVDYVEMDLNENIAFVMFKKNESVNIQALSQKVYDAGFSVRNMQVLFNFNMLQVINNSCFSFEQKDYLIVNIHEKILNGEKTLNFIDRKMMPWKEFRSYKSVLKKSCSADKKPDFYVTLY